MRQKQTSSDDLKSMFLVFANGQKRSYMSSQGAFANMTSLPELGPPYKAISETLQLQFLGAARSGETGDQP